MANPSMPAWLAAVLAPAGAVIGGVAGKLVERWRLRRRDHAIADVHEATAADKLVGTALGLVEQLRLELEQMRERLATCQKERSLQENMLAALREIIGTLTEERDSLRTLLDEATRPR